MQIHPVLIGIINAILPGLGYLLIKERMAFGWMIFAATVLGIVLMFVDPSWNTMFFSSSALGTWIEGLIYLLAVFGFGYDAYDLAHKKRKFASVSEY